MEKIKGKVDAISQKTGGISINGVWYSSTEKTRDWILKLQKGENVILNVNNGKVIFCQKDTSIIQNESTVNNTAEKINNPEEDLKYLLEKIMNNFTAIMTLCKIETDKIFGADPKYDCSRGQHCNSLFIAVERAIRDKIGRVV